MDSPVMPWCVRGKDPKRLRLAWTLTGFHTLSQKAAGISLPKSSCFHSAHQWQMDLVTNLFAINCIHKHLNFTYNYLEIRNFESRLFNLPSLLPPSCLLYFCWN